MIKSSLSPLLQMSPAELHRGPFWSLAAYFACALLSLQNMFGVLLSAWWRTKKFSYLLYTPGCCSGIKDGQSTHMCKTLSFLFEKKTFPYSNVPIFPYPRDLACAILCYGSTTDRLSPIAMNSVWYKLEVLRVNCDSNWDCQIFSFFILRSANNSKLVPLPGAGCTCHPKKPK